MSWYSRSRYPRQLSVAERRRRADKQRAKLQKSGRALAPVVIEGRAIARTFWGKAWCKNLESYSDYANRLPRGRTYVRHSGVLDLRIEEGRVEALVSGKSTYQVTVRIDTLPEPQWEALQRECAGQIDSMVDLLQGELSQGVMEIVSRPGQGLFPTPPEIHLSCSCPDWAVMCKHVAATLYGVGARLDHEPELLFTLRGVDPGALVEQVIDQGVTRRPARGRVLEVDDLSSVFGVDIDLLDEPEQEEVPSELPDRARRVLEIIRVEPGLRTPQLAERLGVSRSAVTRAVAILRERGLVVFVGAPRSGGYQLNSVLEPRS